MNTQPAGHAALRTALMLKIFENWESDQQKNANELAKQIAAEEVLIGMFSFDTFSYKYLA